MMDAQVTKKEFEGVLSGIRKDINMIIQELKSIKAKSSAQELGMSTVVDNSHAQAKSDNRGYVVIDVEETQEENRGRKSSSK